MAGAGTTEVGGNTKSSPYATNMRGVFLCEGTVVILGRGGSIGKAGRDQLMWFCQFYATMV